MFNLQMDHVVGMQKILGKEGTLRSMLPMTMVKIKMLLFKIKISLRKMKSLEKHWKTHLMRKMG